MEVEMSLKDVLCCTLKVCENCKKILTVLVLDESGFKNIDNYDICPFCEYILKDVKLMSEDNYAFGSAT